MEYQDTCDLHNIESLEQRRKKYIDRFVAKATRNERFAEEWFPQREEAGPEVRERRVFHETYARTNRYYNSPLSFMRRRANDLLVH